ncbi:MAG: hypothetical protein FD163_2348 [Hyphomonadaceae bacterium]|nr:MAG: hypothetical protein FD128_360 [Hyphomonadaceae bacterium]KAF0183628.1 MAG: hypothetical protein FD163_2348 [Hyphomonadaceae bacterium]
MKQTAKIKINNLGAIAGCLFLSLLAACGQPKADSELKGWRKEVGQIRLGVNTGEDAATALTRWNYLKERLSRITGLRTEIFQATDYNGVIQALASGQLEMAQMGASAYANARDQMGTKVEPILTSRTAEGLSGYYSILVVRADSPYRKLEDLRGKTVGYVDFNSTSGYLYPRNKMLNQGLDAETFFGKSVVSGGHSQGVLGLANGQFDAVFALANAGTPETGFTNGTIWALARKGSIKASDFRIIWTAGPMPNSPYVIRTDRPQIFQDIMRGALAALPYEDPERWKELGMPEGSDLMPVANIDYAEILEMRHAEVAQRRGMSKTGEKR